MKRYDGRKTNELRSIRFEKNVLDNPPGSVIVHCGNTRVLVAVTVDKGVPPYKRDSGEGWLTAEYNMLPASSNSRIRRERFKVGGRTQEIQRLIGRTLRMAVNLEDLVDKTVTIDCDVIQADGGTRTASITGAWVALDLAFKKLIKDGELKKNPLKEKIGAISVGIVDGRPLLDLNYIEDSGADADMNIIMTESGKIVEIQGTAESEPFSKAEFDQLFTLAEKGLKEIFILQSE